MGKVTGPISSLPGRLHNLPDATMCDDHPNVPAVARIQGETDSFGCEMYDVCQKCLDGIRRYKPEPRHCDWCGKTAELRPQRDYDEGLYGPVYDVCSPCIRKANDAAQAELDEDY